MDAQQIDPRLGAKLAEGACADVYEWGGDGTRIVKLAKPNTNLHALQRELGNSRVAWQLGLPVPRPFELVQAGGRHGIVLERVAGRTILQTFAALAAEDRPLHADDDCLHARTTARVLHRIHSHTAEDLPPQRPSLERDVRRSLHLTDQEKDAVMALLDGLPARWQLCHGDPNPGNFLLNDGDAIAIDWNNATLGNPEADLAEYVLMLRYAMLPPATPPHMLRLFDASRETSIQLFTEEYERLSGIGAAQIAPWIGPIAARKLAVDGTTDAEKQHLVAEVRRALAP